MASESSLPRPTDRELQDLWNELYWEPGKQTTPMIYTYAREVLKKWGKPRSERIAEFQPLSDW
jgi:hypothetical protein